MHICAWSYGLSTIIDYWYLPMDWLIVFVMLCLSQAEQHFLKHNDAGSWIQDSALMLCMSKEVPWYLVFHSCLCICIWRQFSVFVVLNRENCYGPFHLLFPQGWWYRSCICRGCTRCYWPGTNCWEWDFWRVRAVPCAWDFGLPPRSQGAFLSLTFNATSVLLQLLTTKIHFRCLEWSVQNVFFLLEHPWLL